MATAGTPPSTKPCSARMTNIRCQFGAKAVAIVNTAAPISEIDMRLRRPSPSDTAAAQTMAIARKPVESDRASELSAGLTENSCAKIGNSGCTQ